MKKLNIGIIGVGNISNAHIKGYLKDERVELYAFCDINPVHLKEMGEKYSVERLYENIDDMLALSELDAVSICTWNNSHAECAIKAMKAGKHVLCEKPMAISTELAEEMERVSKETGKLLMIGFVRRFGADCAMLKEFKENGFFGDIYYTKANILRRHGNPGGWFGDKSLSGGGPLIDLGVHVIDLICHIMGDDIKPVSVYGATFKKLLNRKGVKDKPPYLSRSASDNDVCDVEDLATALIRFDNDAVLSIEVSFSLNLRETKSSIEIYGTKGGATIAPELVLSTEIDGRMANIDLCAKSTFSFDDGFAAETRHFADCILEGKECRNPAKHGVKLMKILDAIYKSSEEKKEVVIEW